MGESVIVTGYSFPARDGSVLVLDCQDGFVLIGPRNRTSVSTVIRCENNGLWNILS